MLDLRGRWPNQAQHATFRSTMGKGWKQILRLIMIHGSSYFSTPCASPTAAAHHESAHAAVRYKDRRGHSSQTKRFRTQLHPLKAASRAGKVVAALAKLRFRAFPSKCYTKYLVESQTCSHVATKTLSIADGTCGTFVNNIFSTIFLEFQSFGNRRWAIQLSNHGQERSQAAALLALAFALALLVGFLFCCRALAFPAANGLSKAF